MNWEQIMKRMSEINEELKAEGADVEKLDAEYRSLQGKLKAVRLEDEIVKDLNAGAEARKVDRIGDAEEGGVKADAEKRGAALKEKRSVTVAASNVLMQKTIANDIKPGFNEIGTLGDRVGVKVLIGGEAFQQPYIKGYGEGAYTGESDNYASAEPQFGYADIAKSKITAYAEDTEEVQKLPAADYDAVVQDGISKAIRKKINREILTGDGTTGHFTGIFHNPSDADKRIIDPDTDLEISAITNTTLDEIIYAYGGDEDTEDAATLILNKKDLKAFALLRAANGTKLHDIKRNGNFGTIDGVPYILNSACKSLAEANTGDYCIAYGPLSNYLKVIFSDVDMRFSNDYRFKQGIIAHRGSVFMGGNVVAKNGFLRVQKANATLGTLTITSTAGSGTGKSAVTITENVPAGCVIKYKSGASVTAPAYMQKLTTGWTAWNGTDELVLTNGQTIGVALVHAEDNKCVAYGSATIVVA